MKLLKRSLLFLLIFFLIVPQVSLGYDGAKEEEDIDDEAIEEEGVELGESIEVEGELSDPEHVSNINAYWAINVLSGPTKVKKRVKYLTGSWAKANSYTWSKTVSASSTRSSEVGLSAKSIAAKLGVSNTVTTSYSVAVTIPANKLKFSKLGFYSDFNKRRLRVRKINEFTAGVESDKKTDHFAPRKDTYLQVVYQ